MRTRVLQVIEALDRGGTARQLSLLARGLPSAEFDVYVVALRGRAPLADELRSAGVAVAPLDARWRLDPLALARLWRLTMRLQPQVVHAWGGAANQYAFAAARTAGKLPLVLGYRSVDAGRSAPALAADRWLARRAAKVVVNGPGVWDFYAARGLPAEKMTVISGGVPAAVPSPIGRRQLLAELGLPEGARLTGLAGPLLLSKRIKDAIWAADLLKVIRDDVHLLIAGDGPHRRRLETFRDQVAIGDKVHFLGERGDWLRILPHCDVFWSAGACEGQSSAILEAMAAGVPVVATDIPGTRNLVLAGETGCLVPVGDRASIARHTNNLLDDSRLSRRLGQASRQRALGEFRVETFVARYAELYRELARAGRAPE